ncbi:MAG: hypothetical protein ACYDHO_03230 [Gaiellaceae bacterium]
MLSHPAETSARVEHAFDRATSLSWESYLLATDAFIVESLAALAR